jgi:peroxiredoxin
MPVPTGSSAPDFEVTDLQNRLIKLSTSLDAPVVLYFFNINCTWCRSDTTKLANAFRRHRDLNIHILAISTEGAEQAAVEAFATEHELDVTIARDTDGQITQSYAVERVPSLVFINKSGDIVANYQGASEQLPAMTEVTLLSLARGDELPDFALIGNGCAPR